VIFRSDLTISYTDNSFTECDADAAYPPGLYPLANGSTSTFAQRYTGTYTADGGSIGTFTVGQTVTPQTPFSIPASSNCKTYSTVSNGIASLAAAGATGAKTSGASASTSGASASGTSGVSASAASGASGASMAVASGASSVKSAGQSGASAAGNAAVSATKSGAAYAQYQGANYGSIVGGLVSVVAVVAGAGALLL